MDGANQFMEKFSVNPSWDLWDLWDHKKCNQYLKCITGTSIKTEFYRDIKDSLNRGCLPCIPGVKNIIN